MGSSHPTPITTDQTTHSQLIPEPDIDGMPHSTKPLTDSSSELKRDIDPPIPSSASQARTVIDDEDTNLVLVDWDGPDDPKNPKNWHEGKKWRAAITMSLFTLMSALSSSMVAPAAFQIADDLHITESVEVSMTISIFVLAYAVGPLFLGPLSEIYGRVIVLQLANGVFVAFNLACGFAQNKGQFMAFRFLAGLGGSAPLSVGGGLLADLWNADKRGKAIGVYSLAPLLGPVIGPVAGGFVAEFSVWRWVFWAITIADAAVQGVGFLFLKETYAPVLLQRKATRIRAQIAAEKGHTNTVVKTVYEQKQGDISLREWLIRSLVRPFTLFIQEPIIQLFGVYLAFVYGVLYIVLTTLPRIYTEVYNQKIDVVGLHYIALGLGMTTAAQINSVMIDRMYRILTKKHGGVGKPEYRLVPIIPGTLCLPIGLLIGGWTAQARTHWIGPDIGFYFLGVGAASVFQGLQTYVIDSFNRYAASALAAVSCFRSLAGFGFPLFAPYMYDALGYGKGDTILAAFCLGVGTPAMVLFWMYGEKIRALSKRARTTTHVPTTIAEKPANGSNAA